VVDGWAFDVDGEQVWQASVPAASSEDGKRRFFAAAVPAIAEARLGAAPSPCVVVAHVTAPTSGSAVGGPRGRAKAALDALHDDRSQPPYYRELAVTPPLSDDAPGFVAGLAVEVRAGAAARTEYRIGQQLRCAIELVELIDVDAAAPNDISASPAEELRRKERCRRYAQAVVGAWASTPRSASAAGLRALVVRHWPERDEDNSWATWTTALAGARGMRAGHWAERAPLAGWAPPSIATVAGPGLPLPVRYELYR
jgi:hypothetical protein